MKRFSTFVKDQLQEALVTLGGKTYPKNGHVVILAGGAASGKGFISNKLVAIDGKTFDVDEIKKSILKHKKLRAEFKKDLQKLVDTGKLKKMPNIDDPLLLKKSLMVTTLHATNKRIGLSARIQSNFFKSLNVKDPQNHPNIIFDVTLKDITKLHNLSALLLRHGYEKKNIHIVWIANDIALAVDQNADRERVVPKDILIDTHEGAARTMADILKMGNSIKKYMDGDIWIVPNKTAASGKPQNSKLEKSGKGGGWFVFFDTYQIKKAGGNIALDKMVKDIAGKKHNLTKELQKDVPKGTFKL